MVQSLDVMANLNYTDNWDRTFIDEVSTVTDCDFTIDCDKSYYSYESFIGSNKSFTLTDMINHVEKVPGLKIMHLNLRSIKNKFEEIKEIVKRSGAQITCFTESWLHSLDLDSSFYIEGYYLLRSDRGIVNYKKNKK